MGCLFPGVRDTRLGRVLGLCASLIWSMPMHLAARYFTPFADPENHALRQVVLSVWVRTRHGCEEQQIQNSGLEHNSVKRWLKRNSKLKRPQSHQKLRLGNGCHHHSLRAPSIPGSFGAEGHIKMRTVSKGKGTLNTFKSFP